MLTVGTWVVCVHSDLSYPVKETVTETRDDAFSIII